MINYEYKCGCSKGRHTPGLETKVIAYRCDTCYKEGRNEIRNSNDVDPLVQFNRIFGRVPLSVQVGSETTYAGSSS